MALLKTTSTLLGTNYLELVRDVVLVYQSLLNPTILNISINVIIRVILSRWIYWFSCIIAYSQIIQVPGIDLDQSAWCSYIRGMYQYEDLEYVIIMVSASVCVNTRQAIDWRCGISTYTLLGTGIHESCCCALHLLAACCPAAAATYCSCLLTRILFVLPTTPFVEVLPMLLVIVIRVCWAKYPNYALSARIVCCGGYRNED